MTSYPGKNLFFSTLNSSSFGFDLHDQIQIALHVSSVYLYGREQKSCKHYIIGSVEKFTWLGRFIEPGPGPQWVRQTWWWRLHVVVLSPQ